jgi:hypothetical protein
VTGRGASRAIGGLTVAVVLATVLAACSSGSSDSTTPSTSPSAAVTTALVPGTAKIVMLDVPATAQCPAQATQTQFTVTWKTSGAKSTVVKVDGAPIPGATRTSGSARAQVHCDPLPHDVVIIATDDNGHFTSDRKIITTNASPA